MTEALILALLAFAQPQDFRAPVAVGGGGERRFTGSPLSKWDCGVCHDPKPGLALEVKATPATLFTDGYVPGQAYELQLKISEAAPVSSAFAVEIVTRGRKVAGTFTAAPGQRKCDDGFEVVELQDSAAGVGEAAQSRACVAGLTTWKVGWVAPATDVGTVTLYGSAVVGDNSGNNLGDASTARVLGIPAPSTASQRSAGCGGAAALLFPLGLALFVRRRSAALWVVVLLPALADAKPKPRPKPTTAVTPVAPATRATPSGVNPVTPSEVEGRASPVPADPTPSAPTPVTPSEVTPVTPSEVEGPTTPPEPEDPFGPALHVEVETGFGFRSLALVSESFATPLRVAYGYPVVAVAMGFRPMRLLRVHALEGLEIEGAYQRGWVVGQLLTGAVPSDGRITLGYVLELGPVTIAPRAVFRVLVGGVEKNFLFDDPWYQSAGGELGLDLALGPVTIFARPQVTKLFDTGTLTETTYGKAQGGLVLGGEGGLSLRLGQSGFSLSLGYRFTRTTAAWAGNGERALGPIAAVDQTHQGALSLRYRR